MKTRRWILCKPTKISCRRRRIFNGFDVSPPNEQTARITTPHFCSERALLGLNTQKRQGSPHQYGNT